MCRASKITLTSLEVPQLALIIGIKELVSLIIFLKEAQKYYGVCVEFENASS
jgi:hypothetical protein